MSIVRMVFTKTTTSFINSEDSFLLKSGANWLQRQAWKFLQNTKALSPAQLPFDTYTHIEIDGDKLIDKLYRTYLELRNFNRVPDHIYIGPDDMKGLAYESSITAFGAQPAQLKLTGMVRLGNMSYDVPITVVPHMKGLLVV